MTRDVDTVPESTLADDAPVTQSSDDRLHRAEFARRVAALMLLSPQSSGIVFGLYAPWGDGKTSVLNMVKESLSRSTVPVVVRDFNPWRLTDEDAMLKGFFNLLASAIQQSLQTDSERRRSWLGNRAKEIRWVSTLAGVVYPPAMAADALLKKAEVMSSTGDSVGLEQLRARLTAKLAESKVRVVVVIDDIDRLDRAETHALFRIIKACADFPGVTYLLAFDDDAVSKSLAQRYGDGQEQSGRAFLEKIVQVPLRLPAVANEDLRTLCFDHVEKVLAEASVELTQSEATEFAYAFERRLLPAVRTPRGAKRYGNALSFAVPALIGEVSVPELLLVEGIRCFYPEIHEVIRTHQAHFTGAEPHSMLGGQEVSGQRAADLLAPKLERLASDEAEAVRDLLIDLFPRVGPAFGRTTYGQSWVAGWTEKKRIASPQYCPRYFTYGLPSGDVSDSYIEQLVDTAKAGDPEPVEALLRAALGTASEGRVIEKMRVVEATVDPVSAPALAVAIARMGEKFPSGGGLMNWGSPNTQAAMTVASLVARLVSGGPRVELARQVVGEAAPLWFGAECIRWMYVTDKPERSDDNTLTKEEIGVVREVLITRIGDSSANGDALFDVQNRETNNLLFEWWRGAGREPVQAHLVSLFERDCEHVGAFLEAMTPQAWGSAPVPFVSDFDGDVYTNVELLIDPEVLAAFVRKCWGLEAETVDWVEGGAIPVRDRLARQFLYVHDHRREGSTATKPADGDA